MQKAVRKALSANYINVDLLAVGGSGEQLQEY